MSLEVDAFKQLCEAQQKPQLEPELLLWVSWPEPSVDQAYHGHGLSHPSLWVALPKLLRYHGQGLSQSYLSCSATIWCCPATM